MTEATQVIIYSIKCDCLVSLYFSIKESYILSELSWAISGGPYMPTVGVISMEMFYGKLNN